MKKTHAIAAILLVGTLMLPVAAWAWGGKSGDGNASGQITQLKVSASGASVQGTTRNGKLWLAYTVYWNDGLEKDYTPVKVKGKFSENLSFQLRPQGVERIVVCLWRYKVSEKRCAKDNGGNACQYCRKNGFHMEGRIDRRSGS